MMNIHDRAIEWFVKKKILVGKQWGVALGYGKSPDRLLLRMLKTGKEIEVKHSTIDDWDWNTDNGLNPIFGGKEIEEAQ